MQDKVWVMASPRLGNYAQANLSYSPERRDLLLKRQWRVKKMTERSEYYHFYNGEKAALPFSDAEYEA